MIIKPQRRHQSISTARAHQSMIPSMAGSRTYGGPAYYDSHLPVTAHLTFCLCHLYLLPVKAFNHAKNSSIIVKLLEALSQVMWPIFVSKKGVSRWCHVKTEHPYLLYNTNMFADLEQYLSKSLAIMCIVNLCETKDRGSELPLSWSCLFDPMTCHGKITICVACLPGIAC